MPHLHFDTSQRTRDPFGEFHRYIDHLRRPTTVSPNHPLTRISGKAASAAAYHHAHQTDHLFTPLYHEDGLGVTGAVQIQGGAVPPLLYANPMVVPLSIPPYEAPVAPMVSIQSLLAYPQFRS